MEENEIKKEKAPFALCLWYKVMFKCMQLGRGKDRDRDRDSETQKNKKKNSLIKKQRGRRAHVQRVIIIMEVAFILSGVWTLLIPTQISKTISTTTAATTPNYQLPIALELTSNGCIKPSICKLATQIDYKLLNAKCVRRRC